MTSNEDEQAAIFREIDAFTEAFSRGDEEKLASFFTEDGVRVGPGGEVQRGRSQLENGYRKFFEGHLARAKVTQERGSVRMIGPDLALWQGGMQITRPKAPGAITGYVVQVMKKVNGRWLVLESHPKIYPRR